MGILMAEVNEFLLPNYKPWLNEDHNDVEVSKIVNISTVLRSLCIEESPLYIVDARGIKYGRSFLMNINADSLNIYRPWDWNINVSSCHIFFNYEDNWHYFELNQIETEQYDICAKTPKEMYRLQIMN